MDSAFSQDRAWPLRGTLLSSPIRWRTTGIVAGEDMLKRWPSYRRFQSISLHCRMWGFTPSAGMLGASDGAGARSIGLACELHLCICLLPKVKSSTFRLRAHWSSIFRERAPGSAAIAEAWALPFWKSVVYHSPHCKIDQILHFIYELSVTLSLEDVCSGLGPCRIII